jgi:hypothetical protein
MTPLNLQNLHPRFKSGRRLQIPSIIRTSCEETHTALTVALTFFRKRGWCACAEVIHVGDLTQNARGASQQGTRRRPVR